MGTVKYTGPVASFHCPTNADIRSLKVHFSPKQEGTGDPSPENVREIVGWDGIETHRCGKNLLNPKDNPIWNNGTYIINDDNTIIVKSSDGRGWVSTQIKPFPLKKGTYTFSWTGSPRVQFATSEDNYETVTAYSKYNFTFTLSEDGFIKWKHTGSSTDYPLTVTVQIERGSTVTPYEPYHGSTTNYEFGVLGKNKLPIGTATFTRYKQYDLETPLLPGTYTISASINSNDTDESQSLILFEKAGKNDANLQVQLSRDVRTSKTFTLVNLCAKVYIYAAKSYASSADDEATWTDVQLELGSIATTYEPYNPNHTVYGGWVDLISGEVCEEWRILHFVKNYFMGVVDRYGVNYAASARIGNAAATRLFRCDKLNSTVINTLKDSPLNPPYDGAISPDKRLVFALPEEITTLEQVKDLIDDIGGLDVAYEIETPNTYSLAPTQLQTFLGTNNVWSNADYVEVEYDLHETQDILARKQFIMASQPHVEEASGAIATFTTDMAAKLKECKVGFKPVQEGEGDPSPENVRAISGWTGIEVTRCGKNFSTAATGTEIAQKWPTNNSSSRELLFTGMQPGQEFTLSASFTKASEPSSNKRLYLNGSQKTNSTTNAIFQDPSADGPRDAVIHNWVDTDGTIRISHNNRGLTYNDDFIEYAASLQNIQLEVGDTATEFEPYNGETIPITFPASINLLDTVAKTANKTLYSTGEEMSESGMTVTTFMKVSEGSEYTLTFTSTEGARTRRIYGYDSNKDPVQALASASWVNVDSVGTLQATIPSGIEYIRVCYKTADTNISLIGPESSVFYGGYVDLTTGEIWKTYDKIVLDGDNIQVNNGNYESNGNYGAGLVYVEPTGKSVKYKNGLPLNLWCENIPLYIGVNTIPEPPYVYAPLAGKLYFVVYVAKVADHPELSDKTARKNYVNEWLKQNPITLVYELETPTIVGTLSPSQLKSLRGINNVWSNTNGNITVKYWKH